MPVITYRLRFKEGDDIKNLINKAEKLHEKLLTAEGKTKDFTKDDSNLPIIKLIISSI